LIRESVPQQMHAVLDGVCRALGARYELDYYPLILPVINDAALARASREVVSVALGEQAVVATQVACPVFT